ncbi:hypothetical protein [Marinomonas mediterranea]|uniref:hypothetical protein n=1 Tax=Marinomonas mediterranea TaxID=119864 RepID=UPI00234A7741|nr:hypothetical protein [Marinomonas mediterranea]WCN07575.1 hypothetical protein GV055_00870 [Marinomonas mediterranea]WCN11673.1 hypothetical protein GV054_00880 [Marinomonas mediterranea]
MISAFLGLYFIIFAFLAAGFPNRSKVIDGYFAYKPDIAKKAILYESVPIYALNCIRYVLFIEQPSMPWWAKINVILSGLGCCGCIYLIIILVMQEDLGLIDIYDWIYAVKQSELPLLKFG